VFNSSGDRVPDVEFSTRHLKAVVDDFVGFCEKVDKTPLFTVTGGDPLLYPHIWELLEYIRSKNIRITILGNPFHLDSTSAKRLFDLGCRGYQMSLDGLRETHDYIRMPGSFDATIDKIEVLQASGIKAYIMATVSALNYQEMPQLARLVTDLGVDIFTFARYCPGDGDGDLILAPDVYRAFLTEMWGVYSELSERGTTFTLKDHLWKLYLHEIGLMEPKDGDIIYEGCGCGISHMTLLEDGSVYACRRFTSPVGNIYEQDFASIFFGGEMCVYRDVDRLEGCRDCELLNLCRGCHAVSATSTGDFFKRDPQCWK